MSNVISVRATCSQLLLADKSYASEMTDLDIFKAIYNLKKGKIVFKEKTKKMNFRINDEPEWKNELEKAPGKNLTEKLRNVLFIEFHAINIIKMVDYALSFVNLNKEELNDLEELGDWLIIELEKYESLDWWEALFTYWVDLYDHIVNLDEDYLELTIYKLEKNKSNF